MSGIMQMLLAAFQRVTDPFFEYVTLLLPGNGTNGAQNNTFLDSSTNAFSITRNGNTTQGTFSPFSQTGWGNYFDGTGDSLTTPSITIGSGDFTIEGWQYMLPNGANYGRLVGVGDFFNSSGFAINFNPSTSKFEIGNANSNFIISSGTFSFNTWYHIAVVRSGSTVTLYVNGTSQGSATNTNSISGVVYISAVNYLSTIYYALSYTSNVRITTSAVYTTNFTPPTAPLTAISNTQLLTCQSNRFIDNSTNNFAITRNGDVSVQAFSPFNPTAAWSAATYGGSGYFDGSGDYLSVADNTALDISGQFTWECWVYFSSISGSSDNILYSKLIVTPSVTGLEIGVNTTGKFYVWINGSVVITSTSSVSAGQWVHLAASRDGSNNVRIFINGTSAATAVSNSADTSTSASVILGANYAGSARVTGYISNFRLVKGTAVYTANFTPPTSPLTAITNTSLLCNFTNAGIYDATSKNDLETVGNAQISTTQSKFGGSSMYFDGTDDRLVAPSNIDVAIGAADFTIEGWFYTASPATNRGLFQISTTAGGLEAGNTNNLAVYCSSSVLGVYYASTFKAGTTSISANTWTHFALVRTGGSTKLYVNGTADSGFGTNADTQNYTGKNVCVGGYFSTTYLWSGYIQDFRITRGYARYTSNFTAPTAAFPVL